ADEVLGQLAGLVASPGLEGGDELDLVDQAVLQREQTEEQVTFGGDGGHGAGLQESRRWRWAFGLRRRGPAAGTRRIGSDYPTMDHHSQPHLRPTGMRLSGAWRSSIEPGTSRYFTGPLTLILAKYNMRLPDFSG